MEVLPPALGREKREKLARQHRGKIVGCCLSFFASQPLEVEELEETWATFLHVVP